MVFDAALKKDYGWEVCCHFITGTIIFIWFENWYIQYICIAEFFFTFRCQLGPVYNNNNINFIEPINAEANKTMFYTSLAFEFLSYEYRQNNMIFSPPS